MLKKESFFTLKLRYLQNPISLFLQLITVKIRKCKKMREAHHFTDYPETHYIEVLKTIIITPKTSRKSSNHTHNSKICKQTFPVKTRNKKNEKIT